MSPIRITLSAAAVAGLVVLSGCAGGAPAPAAPQTTVTVEAPKPVSPSESEMPGDAGDTTEPVDPPPTTSEPAPTGEPAPTAPTEQPFAVRQGAIGDARVVASVYPVHRAGRTATVNVLLAAADPEEKFSLQGQLSDGNPEVGSREMGAVDGLRLVDASNKKVYLPATTGPGVCACTPSDDRIWVRETAVWVSVIFAAPAADLTAITVFIPQFGTVSNVPLV